MKMLTRAFLCLAVVGAAAPVFAQDRPQQDQDQQRGDHRDDQRGGQRDDQRGDQRGDRHDNGNRNGDRHDDRYDNRAERRGPPPDHGGHWERGHRAPDVYRRDDYVVNDYRSYRLREPPRGYHWVRSDSNDFLLIAITTGVIADIVSQSQ
ncbi:Ni/Co efflux regulator RcnB [Luteibacter rhizovicinus]|uniref:Ni/Co efflux regulator RcnB n=1 Tax=Luteibacter rhizovicinus TaxID=242606 RepID=A0A4R3YMV1_9GAMM|nr:Ni/Co efflux regulator RcnB [Luteibacter rhizovicinus]